MVLVAPTGHASDNASSEPALTSSMKNMKGVLEEILPIVVSDTLFSESSMRKKFREGTEKLATMAHRIDPKSMIIKDGRIDPSIGLIAQLFDVEAKRASDEAKRGNDEYARRIVQGLTSFCISCHTSSSMGPQFTLHSDEAVLKRLTPIEKANFLTATRRFDEALKEYEEFIDNSENARSRKIEWESAVRRSLAISVRVKNDRAKSAELVGRALKSPYMPDFFREDLLGWQKSLKDWAKEVGRKAKTEQGLFAETQLLFSKAKSNQRFPADRVADLDYLRVTAAGHEFLRKYGNGAKAPEILYFLGSSYEALQSMGLWYLGELYFESCVRTAPHSAIAKQCYQRLEMSLFSGYSGSGGIDVPSDVQDRLEGLKKLLKGS